MARFGSAGAVWVMGRTVTSGLLRVVIEDDDNRGGTTFPAFFLSQPVLVEQQILVADPPCPAAAAAKVTAAGLSTRRPDRRIQGGTSAFSQSCNLFRRHVFDRIDPADPAA